MNCLPNIYPCIHQLQALSTPPANSDIFNDNLVSTSTEISTARVSVAPPNTTTSIIPSFNPVRRNLSRNSVSLGSESPTRIPFVPVSTSSTTGPDQFKQLLVMCAGL